MPYQHWNERTKLTQNIFKRMFDQQKRIVKTIRRNSFSMRSFLKTMEEIEKTKTAIIKTGEKKRTELNGK